MKQQPTLNTLFNDDFQNKIIERGSKSKRDLPLLRN